MPIAPSRSATIANDAANPNAKRRGARLDLNGFNQTIGSLAGPGAVTLGTAALTAGGNNDSTKFDGNISGDGSLIKTGSGWLRLTGANSYGGGTLVSRGVLAGTTSGLIGNIVNNGEVAFEQDHDGVFGGSISGRGGVSKHGDGAVTLVASNTYQGETRVTRGILRAGAINVFSPESAAIVDGAGTLDLGEFNQVVGSLAGTGSITLGGGWLMTGANNRSTTFAGTMSGTGGLATFGNGTFTLSGSNTYSGGTFVTSGTLLGNATSLQGHILNNATVIFDQANPGTYAGDMAGTGSLLKRNQGLLVLRGVNSYSGGTTITSGALQGDTASLQGAIRNDATVVFDQSFDGLYADSITGSGSLIKQNHGLLVLGGRNLYEGETVVSGGQLFVTGSISGRGVRVLEGATFGGKGAVPAITIERDGILAPGASIGTLHINGDVTFNAGAIYSIETESNGASDLSLATGTLSLTGGIVRIAAGDVGRYRPINRFTIFQTAGAISGSFAAVESNLDYLSPSLQYDATRVYATLRRNDVDFRAVGTRGNQTAVATTLNSLVSTATGPMASVINNVYDLSHIDARAAVGSMSGLVHQHVAASSITGAQAFMDFNMTRLGRLGAGGAAFASSSIDVPTGVHGATSQGVSGPWIAGLSGFTRYSGNDADPGAGVTMHGLVGGYDAAIGTRVTVGISGADASPVVRLDDAPDQTQSRALHLGIYGRYNHNRSRVALIAGGGGRANTTTRRVADGGSVAEVNADYRDRSAFAQVVYGHSFAIGQKIDLEPELGWQSSLGRVSSFDEAGAGVLSLIAPVRHIRSHRSIAGGRVSKTIERLTGARTMFEARAAWAHEFSPIEGMAVRFAGDTATGGFVIASPDRVGDSALLGTRITGQALTHFTFFGTADGEMSGSTTRWTIGAGVRATW